MQVTLKDEKRIATTDMMMVHWEIVVSLLEHSRIEEILEEAQHEPIAIATRSISFESPGNTVSEVDSHG